MTIDPSTDAPPGAARDILDALEHRIGLSDGAGAFRERHRASEDALTSEIAELLQRDWSNVWR